MSENNNVLLIGSVASEPIFHHEYDGEQFYSVTLKSDRTSSASDFVPVFVSDKWLDTYLGGEEIIEIHGELRSYNEHCDDGTHLKLNVFANELFPTEYADENDIFLRGYLCKPPNYRKTPKGREITDLTLAVNRSYGKTDYIPVICWGRTALLAKRLKTGDQIEIEGRIQSREYTKNGEIKTAYEVSASDLRCLS